MNLRDIARVIAVYGGIVLGGVVPAWSQCALPHQIANGQPADADDVMDNFNALLSCINSAPDAGGLYRQVLSATPTTASTGLSNWLNQGSSSVSDTTTGVALTAPSSGTSENFVVRYKAAPSAPYTITALIASARSSTSHNSVGIGWYDGASKLHVISFAQPASTNNLPYFTVQKWNSVTSWNSSDVTAPISGVALPVWMRIADNGTNVSFSFSQDGANFFTMFSVAKSSGWLGATGYSNVLFFVNPKGSLTIGSIMSWTQS